MAYDKNQFLNVLAAGLCSKGRIGKKLPTTYIAASQIKKPVAYSYNGVVLPALPEWDNSKYPYAIIYSTMFSSKPYYLEFYPYPWVPYEGGDENEVYRIYSGYELEYMWTPARGEWVYRWENTVNGRIHGDYDSHNSMLISEVVWTNTDIYDIHGNLRVAASEPVPVYTPKYTELDYIESSGTQYIDTGFKPNGNTRVVMDFEPLSSSDLSSYYTYFGCRSSGLFFALVKALNTNFNLYWQYENLYSNIWSIADINEYAKRRTIDANGATVTMDGITKTYPAKEFQSLYNMYLFGNNQAGTANMLSHARIYSCQIYDNGTLIRDYVPCKTDDDQYGLLDKVERKFYGNAGNGSFIGGPEI